MRQQRLRGVSFRWSCWDLRDVICRVAMTSIERSAYLRGNDAVAQLDRLQLPSESVGDEPLSLGIWACYESGSIPAVCQAMRELSQRDPVAMRLCYVSPELSPRTSILVEAGAQMVVSEISDVAGCLQMLFPKARLFCDGNHPLTTGLINRLPWQSVADHRPE